jgi:hypothetical protein
MRRRSREEAPWSAAAAACTARRMSFRLRLLLLLAWPNRRQADATDGADGDADLRCSACDMFVTQYLARCYATVFAKDATAVASVYRVRVAEVYKQHAPDRLYLVDGLLTKARRRSAPRMLALAFGCRCPPNRPPCRPPPDAPLLAYLCPSSGPRPGAQAVPQGMRSLRRPTRAGIRRHRGRPQPRGGENTISCVGTGRGG